MERRIDSIREYMESLVAGLSGSQGVKEWDTDKALRKSIEFVAKATLDASAAVIDAQAKMFDMRTREPAGGVRAVGAAATIGSWDIKITFPMRDDGTRDVRSVNSFRGGMNGAWKGRTRPDPVNLQIVYNTLRSVLNASNRIVEASHSEDIRKAFADAQECMVKCYFAARGISVENPESDFHIPGKGRSVDIMSSVSGDRTHLGMQLKHIVVEFTNTRANVTYDQHIEKLQWAADWKADKTQSAVVSIINDRNVITYQQMLALFDLVDSMVSWDGVEPSDNPDLSGTKWACTALRGMSGLYNELWNYYMSVTSSQPMRDTKTDDYPTKATIKGATGVSREKFVGPKMWDEAVRFMRSQGVDYDLMDPTRDDKVVLFADKPEGERHMFQSEVAQKNKKAADDFFKKTFVAAEKEPATYGHTESSEPYNSKGMYVVQEDPATAYAQVRAIAICPWWGGDLVLGAPTDDADKIRKLYNKVMSCSVPEPPSREEKKTMFKAGLNIHSLGDSEPANFFDSRKSKSHRAMADDVAAARTTRLDVYNPADDENSTTGWTLPVNNMLMRGALTGKLQWISDEWERAKETLPEDTMDIEPVLQWIPDDTAACKVVAPELADVVEEANRVAKHDIADAVIEAGPVGTLVNKVCELYSRMPAHTSFTTSTTFYRSEDNLHQYMFFKNIEQDKNVNILEWHRYTEEQWRLVHTLTCTKVSCCDHSTCEMKHSGLRVTRVSVDVAGTETPMWEVETKKFRCINEPTQRIQGGILGVVPFFVELIKSMDTAPREEFLGGRSVAHKMRWSVLFPLIYTFISGVKTLDGVMTDNKYFINATFALCGQPWEAYRSMCEDYPVKTFAFAMCMITIRNFISQVTSTYRKCGAKPAMYPFTLPKHVFMITKMEGLVVCTRMKQLIGKGTVNLLMHTIRKYLNQAYIDMHTGDGRRTLIDGVEGDFYELKENGLQYAHPDLGKHMGNPLVVMHGMDMVIAAGGGKCDMRQISSKLNENGLNITGSTGSIDLKNVVEISRLQKAAKLTCDSEANFCAPTSYMGVSQTTSRGVETDHINKSHNSWLLNKESGDLTGMTLNSAYSLLMRKTWHDEINAMVMIMAKKIQHGGARELFVTTVLGLVPFFCIRSLLNGYKDHFVKAGDLMLSTEDEKRAHVQRAIKKSGESMVSKALGHKRFTSVFDATAFSQRFSWGVMVAAVTSMAKGMTQKHAHMLITCLLMSFGKIIVMPRDAVGKLRSRFYDHFAEADDWNRLITSGVFPFWKGNTGFGMGLMSELGSYPHTAVAFAANAWLVENIDMTHVSTAQFVANSDDSKGLFQCAPFIAPVIHRFNDKVVGAASVVHKDKKVWCVEVMPMESGMFPCYNEEQYKITMHPDAPGARYIPSLSGFPMGVAMSEFCGLMYNGASTWWEAIAGFSSTPTNFVSPSMTVNVFNIVSQSQNLFRGQTTLHSIALVTMVPYLQLFYASGVIRVRAQKSIAGAMLVDKATGYPMPVFSTTLDLPPMPTAASVVMGSGLLKVASVDNLGNGIVRAGGNTQFAAALAFSLTIDGQRMMAPHLLIRKKMAILYEVIDDAIINHGEELSNALNKELTDRDELIKILPQAVYALKYLDITPRLAGLIGIMAAVVDSLTSVKIPEGTGTPSHVKQAAKSKLHWDSTEGKRTDSGRMDYFGAFERCAALGDPTRFPTDAQNFLYDLFLTDQGFRNPMVMGLTNLREMAVPLTVATKVSVIRPAALPMGEDITMAISLSNLNHTNIDPLATKLMDIVFQHMPLKTREVSAALISRILQPGRMGMIVSAAYPGKKAPTLALKFISDRSEGRTMVPVLCDLVTPNASVTLMNIVLAEVVNAFTYESTLMPRNMYSARSMMPMFTLGQLHRMSTAVPRSCKIGNAEYGTYAPLMYDFAASDEGGGTEINQDTQLRIGFLFSFLKNHPSLLTGYGYTLGRALIHRIPHPYSELPKHKSHDVELSNAVFERGIAINVSGGVIIGSMKQTIATVVKGKLEFMPISDELHPQRAYIHGIGGDWSKSTLSHVITMGKESRRYTHFPCTEEGSIAEVNRSTFSLSWGRLLQISPDVVNDPEREIDPRRNGYWLNMRGQAVQAIGDTNFTLPTRIPDPEEYNGCVYKAQDMSNPFVESAVTGCVTRKTEIRFRDFGEVYTGILQHLQPLEVRGAQMTAQIWLQKSLGIVAAILNLDDKERAMGCWKEAARVGRVKDFIIDADFQPGEVMYNTYDDGGGEGFSELDVIAYTAMAGVSAEEVLAARDEFRERIADITTFPSSCLYEVKGCKEPMMIDKILCGIADRTIQQINRNARRFDSFSLCRVAMASMHINEPTPLALFLWCAYRPGSSNGHHRNVMEQFMREAHLSIKKMVKVASASAGAGV
jgi:hypothetical protein